MTAITNLHALPPHMTSRPQWVIAGPDKVPLNPRTGQRADPTDPRSGAPFADALAAAEAHGYSLGFILTREAGVTCIDLDNCIDDDGELAPDAAAIVAATDSYTERSRSRRGVHILALGELPPGRRRTKGVEMYDRDRYIIVTGDVLPGHADIRERSERLAAMHRWLLPEMPTPTVVTPPATPLTLDDDALRAKAIAAKNGAKLERLLGGDLSEYGNDHSAADMAAASILAFWTQDPEQIARIIGNSPLGSRTKWQDRADYRASTINRALQRTTVYSPPEPGTPSSDRSHTVPTVDPCTAERDLIAQLRAEIATLHAELTQARAERDQVKRDLSAVLATLRNPNLGGDAAGKALILAATEVQYQRHRRPPQDGYCRVTASRVADNVRYVDGEPVSAPAQVSARTVTKYLAKASEAGLIEAEKRAVSIPAGDHDISTQVWHWKAAPTLADQLAPLAVGTVYSDDNPRPLRGGDPTKRRHLKKLPGCPACGGYHVACTDCGVIFDTPAGVDLDSGEVLTADEVAREQPQDHQHTVPTDEVVSEPTVDDVTIADKFVSRDRAHTVPTGKTRRLMTARADLQRRAAEATEPLSEPAYLADAPEPWEPAPQPALFAMPEPPPLDHRTDVAYGARR